MIATSFFSRAAVLLGAVRMVAGGIAVVKNQCDFDVYLWSVSQESSAMQTLPANGGQYSETYRKNPDGGGISIKVGRDVYGQNITQYEYTLEDDGLWYDLSLINGNPFVEYGVTVIPADSACNPVICPAGIAACAAAYMIPTDNWATAKCGSIADTVMVLCASEDITNGDPSISSVVSSALATATAAPTHKSQPAATATTVKSVTTTLAAAPKHSTTAAPWHPAPSHGNNVVVHTTFVTMVVTVNARDAAPEPTPVPVAEPVMERRSERRVHRHEHGQQRRHEHAHAHQQEDSA